jgi:hypothetical protein
MAEGHAEMMAEGHEMSAEEKAMMEAWQASMAPGAEHEKLAGMAGSYKLTVTTWTAPGAPPQTSTATADRSVSLGGRVLEEKVAGSMMGTPFEGLARTGYDNVRERYWSTWTDNMSTGLMVMHGTVRDDGTATFEGDTIDPMTGNTIRMRIEGRMEGDKEVNEFYFPGPDGTEMKGMEIIYEPVG